MQFFSVILFCKSEAYCTWCQKSKKHILDRYTHTCISMLTPSGCKYEMGSNFPSLGLQSLTICIVSIVSWPSLCLLTICKIGTIWWLLPYNLCFCHPSFSGCYCWWFDWLCLLFLDWDWSLRLSSDGRQASYVYRWLLSDQRNRHNNRHSFIYIGQCYLTSWYDTWTIVSIFSFLCYSFKFFHFFVLSYRGSPKLFVCHSNEICVPHFVFLDLPLDLNVSSVKLLHTGA